MVLPNVRIGPAHAAGLQSLVADLSFAEKSLGIRIDAIVGLDVLGHEAFSIDYRARQDPLRREWRRGLGGRL